MKPYDLTLPPVLSQMMSFPHGTVFHPQMAAAAVASSGAVVYPAHPQLPPQQPPQRAAVVSAPVNVMASAAAPAPAGAAMGQPTFIYQVR